MGAFVGGRGQFLKKGKFGLGLPSQLRHTCDNTKLLTKVCSAERVLVSARQKFCCGYREI